MADFLIREIPWTQVWGRHLLLNSHIVVYVCTGHLILAGLPASIVQFIINLFQFDQPCPDAAENCTPKSKLSFGYT